MKLRLQHFLGKAPATALTKRARFGHAVFAVVAAGVLTSCAAQRAQRNHDPLEPMNRKIFWFNEKVDIYFMEPVATGYDAVMPDPVQRSVTNFFYHLYFPVNFTNSLLQGKVPDAANAFGRFTVNTTLGVLGLFDPASRWGFEQKWEDVGQTLGWWGVPPGPYLVLPFIGPSNPRDGIGRIGDSVLRIYPLFIPQYVSFGMTALELVDYRALLLGDIRDARKASLDYYVFVRNAYIQWREALVNDGEISEEEKEDLYDLDFEDEE